MLQALVEPLIEKANELKIKVAGVGLGVAGWIDYVEEKMSVSPNIPLINGVKLGQLLSQRIELPVIMENDAACFVRAEALLGVEAIAGAELATLSRALADRFEIPLRPQGPGLVFHTVILKPGAAEGPVRDYRDYVQRHDAARFTHLRRCLLEEGVRAIERGLWFLSLEHSAADISDALARAETAFSRHAQEWKKS